MPPASGPRTQIHGYEYVITICNIYIFNQFEAAARTAVTALDSAAYRINRKNVSAVNYCEKLAEACPAGLGMSIGRAG
jgi:hypothetical protein